jgi:hypothetical protein
MPHYRDKGRFLNADLILASGSDLRPLVKAFGGKIDVLFVGRVKRTYHACLELNAVNPRGPARAPEWAIAKFCKLIQALPPDERRIWDNAKIRTFDIGIDSQEKKPLLTYWFALSPETLKATSDVNASIALTIYGKLKKARATRRRFESSPKVP